MVDSVYCPTNLLFFDIPLFYYHNNLVSSITFCLSSGDTNLSLGISLRCSFVTFSELCCCEFFEAFEISLAKLLPIKSPDASPAF